jgi:MOB kinase activator 1
VAVHAIDFYNDVSTIWAVMAEDPYLDSFRPGEGFPSGVEYRWSSTTTSSSGGAEQQTGGGGVATTGGATSTTTTTVSVSAPVYIEKVLQWIADQINDETKFPDDDDEAEALRVFQTPQFAALCGQIFRRLFRVYGIIYSSFFGTLEALQMAPHLNTCFKHFMFFCTEFGLLPEREMEPLEVLVKPIRKQYHLSKGK